MVLRTRRTPVLGAAAMLCTCGLAIGTACVAGTAAPSDGPADRAPTTGAPTSESPQRDGKPQPKAAGNPTKVSERGDGGGANGDGEPNYGDALVVRARDFPDGLSGTIMCEGFVIPAGELIILGDDLVIESSGPIIINGDLIGGAPWDGLDGVNIVLESTEFIRITGLVQPGDAYGSLVPHQSGGNGGDLQIRAPFTEASRSELRAGNGGSGGPSGRRGSGGSIVIHGETVLFDLVPEPIVIEDRNMTVIGGNRADGGPARHHLIGDDTFVGGSGGHGGSALVYDFEPSDWMLQVIEGRSNGDNGIPGIHDLQPLTGGIDGAASTKPCKAGGLGLPGTFAIGGTGGNGTAGSAGTAMMGAGNGGTGGDGGDARGGRGGLGGRGGDCCGPAPHPFGAGGKGGAGGDGGNARGGEGGNGGAGGNGGGVNPSGGHGGSGGNSGGARGGNAQNGGEGGHGVTPGAGGSDATKGTASTEAFGPGGPGGTAAPGGTDGADGPDGNTGSTANGTSSVDGIAGDTCDIAYVGNNGQAFANDPSGNNGTGQGAP